MEVAHREVFEKGSGSVVMKKPTSLVGDLLRHRQRSSTITATDHTMLHPQPWLISAPRVRYVRTAQSPVLLLLSISPSL